MRRASELNVTPVPPVNFSHAMFPGGLTKKFAVYVNAFSAVAPLPVIYAHGGGGSPSGAGPGSTPKLGAVATDSGVVGASVHEKAKTAASRGINERRI